MLMKTLFRQWKIPGTEGLGCTAVCHLAVQVFCLFWQAKLLDEKVEGICFLKPSLAHITIIEVAVLQIKK
jgi:hypothetical protein